MAIPILNEREVERLFRFRYFGSYELPTVSSRHKVSFSVGRALWKDNTKNFLMSTGKNILMMSALVSKRDLTLCFQSVLRSRLAISICSKP